ncbi:MAG: MurT ligase domain-containing protein [Peptococcaceae bacterium]|nr:MurT ligase domain-containing protein [Peptococcaceae bacterium]
MASLSRVRGTRGSTLPGRVALKICPRFLRLAVRQVRRGVVMVTGTNGKTTTNNMVAGVLESAGYRVIANREGANLVWGVAAAFVAGAGAFGRIKADFATLEVDEASLPVVASHLAPDLLVVTNFFRDQLDRYGELDRTVELVQRAIGKLPLTRLVLNADDPLVAQLGKGENKTLFFGLAQTVRLTATVQTREARFCPACGRELSYAFYHYSQLGDYRCLTCGFARPGAAVEGQAVRGGDRLEFTVRWPAGQTSVSLDLPGYYNVYNALAAFSVGVALGLPEKAMVEGLARFAPAIGRMERFSHRGRPVYLNLVKNPTGFNESLAAMLTGSGTKDVFMAINDNDADGRDISWLWDVDFEALARDPAPYLSFTCAGIRAQDMALRLKYAGVPVELIRVIPGLVEGIEGALAGRGALVYLFSTYTALWRSQAILKEVLARGEEPATGLAERRRALR